MADPEHYGKFTAPLGEAAVVAAVAAESWPLAALGLAALLFSAYSRADGLLLVGPFPRAELVRNVRKYRVHLWRTVIVLAAAVPTLILLYLAPTMKDGALAKAGEGVMLFVFWHLFMIVTAVTVTFLTTAIVEEREAKRLDFLLVTDLRNREIVFGKLLARAAAGLAYLLGTVPLLLLFPYWFGVDPAVPLYLGGYAAVTLFSVGAAAVLGSTLARTRRLGGQQHARLILPYFFVTFLMDKLVQVPEIWFWPGTPGSPARYAVSDLVEFLCLGNPGTLFFQVAAGGPGGLDLRPAAAAFPGYAAFHVGFGFLFLLLSVRGLRRVSAALAGEPPPPKLLATAKPTVWDRPVVWKEMYSRPVTAPQVHRVVAALAVLLLVVAPVAVVLAAAVSDLDGHADTVKKAARVALPILGLVTLLGGMTNGGISVARERDRDTLTTLVLTALTPRDILFEKWLGILGGLRYVAYWIALLGAACVVAGAVPWYALMAFAVTAAVCSGFTAALGLWVSAKAASVEKASRGMGFVLGIGITGLISFTMTAAAFVADDPIPLGPIAVALALPAGLPACTHAGLTDGWSQLAWAAGLAAGWGLYSVLGYAIFNRAVRRFEAAIQSA